MRAHQKAAALFSSHPRADPQTLDRITPPVDSLSFPGPEKLAMTTAIGQPLDVLDSPQLLIDLDIVDANLRRMLDAFRQRPVSVRVHFKSLKCAGLAR